MSVPLRSAAARVLLAAALVAPVTAVAGAAPASAVTRAELERRVVSLVNAERRAAGCANLRVDDRLRTAARKHSRSMKYEKFFSHTSPDGRTPWDRMRAEGYRYGSAENIAAGQPTPKAVVRAWMNSPGHRKNILNCRNKAVGVGVARGQSGYGIWWTQDFGSR